MIMDLNKQQEAARAEYEYQIADRASGRDELQIIDLNRGEMSVTNDLPNVIREIWRELVAHRDLLELNISYRDSQGDWDFIDITPIAGRPNFYQIEIKPGFHRHNA